MPRARADPALIVSVADVLRRRVPRGAIAARISGDRFAIFLPDADLGAAWDVADSLPSVVATR